ncbi:hypothetical protein [Weissella cibaria]|uniref:hypothetical protein n=1 Tax=Weissella cibaria TaxID=137591 RepID=UPI001369D5ED|nr:hypothetical protein [Weissella cibaria]MYV36246.1 hypothetical protein [Weissella cibaria]
MKNTRRLQAKVQHAALATIVIAGLIAPTVQLAPIFPGMSLRDVKAASNATSLDTTTVTPAVGGKWPVQTGVTGQETWLPTSTTESQTLIPATDTTNTYAQSKIGGTQVGIRYANAYGETAPLSSQMQWSASNNTQNYATNTTTGQHVQLAVTTSSMTGGSGYDLELNIPTNLQVKNATVKMAMSDGTVKSKILTSLSSKGGTTVAFQYLKNGAWLSGKVDFKTGDLLDSTGAKLTDFTGITTLALNGINYSQLYNVDPSNYLATNKRPDGTTYTTYAWLQLYVDAQLPDVSSAQTVKFTGNARVGMRTGVNPGRVDQDEYDDNATTSPLTGAMVFNAPVGGTESGKIETTHTFTDLQGNSVTSGSYTGADLVMDHKIIDHQSTDSKNMTYTIRTVPGVTGAKLAKPVEFVNDQGQDVSSLVGNPLVTYYDNSGSVVSDYKQATKAIVNNLTVVGGKSYHIKATLHNDNSMMTGTSDNLRTSGALTGTDVAGNTLATSDAAYSTGMFTWVPFVAMPDVLSTSVKYVTSDGKMVAGGAQVTGQKLQVTPGSYNDQIGIYQLDTSSILSAMPASYAAVSALPDKVYMVVMQAAYSNQNINYGVIATTDSGKGVKATPLMNSDGVTPVTVNIDGVATPLYGYAATPALYQSDYDAAYSSASGGLAAYMPVSVMVNQGVSGNINYVYNGKTVSSTPFTNQEAGKTIANIAAPAGTIDGLRYKLADATKSYAYPDKDGDVNVDLAAIVSGTIEFVDADNNNALVEQQAFTDQTPGAQISPLTLPDGYVLAVDANGDVQSTYNYPTADAQVVTVKVQKLTTGNRNDGMELTEVPSFSSDNNTIGASDTTTLTATKDGVLSYLNLKGQKADIYMSATDLKSNGSALPIKTLKANLSAGLADVYAANQTDGYGHMIVNDTTSKKGSLTIPDLQMTLSNNNFAAGTYSGTINYTMVSDDLN